MAQSGHKISHGVLQGRSTEGLYGLFVENSVELLSHDVTKIQTNKLSIHVCVYFREVFQHLNILVYTNFLFVSVFRFATKDGSISRLLLDAAFAWRPGKLLRGLKTF